MTKSILKITTHSFVDLITNSSSELFVCSGEKSIDTVKEIINNVFYTGLEDELLDEYDRENAKKYKGISPDRIWGEIFAQEVYIADRDFDIHDYPNHEDLISVGYGRYHDKYFDGYWERCENKRKVILEKVGEEPFKDLPHNEKREKQEWKDWQSEYEKIRFQMVKEESQKEHEIREKIHEYFNLPKELEYCISWGISFKKGDMFISGASDNSIPYVYLDAIETTLNAKRYHLG